MELIGVCTVRIVAQIVVRSVVGEVAKSVTRDCYDFVKEDLRPVHKMKKVVRKSKTNREVQLRLDAL